jgi:hypothetical protein
MRVPFAAVFQVERDGKITPKTRIRFGGAPGITEVLLGTAIDPKKPSKGITALTIGKDLEVRTEGEVTVILHQYE